MFFRNLSEDFFQNFFRILDNFSDVVITSHKSADPDAVASSIALKEWIEAYYRKTALHEKAKNIVVFLPKLNQHASVLANSLIEKELLFTLNTLPLHTDFREGYFFDGETLKTSLLILVDAQNLSFTDFPDRNILLSFDEYIVLDHHCSSSESYGDIEDYDEEISFKESPKSSLMEFDKISPSLVLIDEGSSSCSEIILSLFEREHIIPSRDVSRMIGFGILSDTGFFRYATNKTFKHFSFLIQNGLDFSRLAKEFEVPISFSERIARIKGMKNIFFIRKQNPYIIVGTIIGAYEASVCRTLIEAGADVSIAATFHKKNKHFHISSRASPYVLLKTPLHLGTIMKSLSDFFPGVGGGHAGAAGFSGQFSDIKSMEEFKNFFAKFLLKFTAKVLQSLTSSS